MSFRNETTLLEEGASRLLDRDLQLLFTGLADRISSAPHPSWPMDIFEAESYLYRYFLRRLLDTIERLAVQQVTLQSAVDFFLIPSRVVELCYLLLGVSFSGLSVHERRRLASYLVQVICGFRPADPFCTSGRNILLTEPLATDYWTPGFVPTLTPESRKDERRLVASLSALCEFIQVGIPQYCREIHGPYRTQGDGSVLVRSHVGLRMQELWPPLEWFPYDTVEVVELYDAIPGDFAIDLTNHLHGAESLWGNLRGFSLRASVPGGRLVPVTLEQVLCPTLSSLQHCRSETAEFCRSGWLRKHLDVRSYVLAPICGEAGCSWRPAPIEYEALAGPSECYEHVKPRLSKDFSGLLGAMCEDFVVGDERHV